MLPQTTMKQHDKFVIIHVDLDCFYAQVEEVDNPSYRDKPIGIQQNQTISTVNYCGRKMGIPKMTRIRTALEVCPSLIVIPARMEVYREVSRQIFDCIEERINSYHGDCILEVTGIDEAYIDVTEEVKWRLNDTALYPPNDCRGIKVSRSPTSQDVHLNIASQIALEIRDEVFSNHGYTLSAGVAHSKFLAKLASKKNKPNGQAVIYSESFNDEVSKLDISDIPYIGHETSKKIHGQHFISTVHELRGLSVMDVRRCFTSEKLASKALNIANGKYCDDYDRVVPRGPPKSIASELTFLPIQTYEDVELKLSVIAQDLHCRIQRDLQRNNQRKATRFTLKYCFGTFRDKFHSKSCKIDSKSYCSRTSKDWTSLALGLFKEEVSEPFKLTRISIGVSDFSESKATSGGDPMIREHGKNVIGSVSSVLTKRKATPVVVSDSKQQSITSFLQKKVKKQ